MEETTIEMLVKKQKKLRISIEALEHNIRYNQSRQKELEKQIESLVLKQKEIESRQSEI